MAKRIKAILRLPACPQDRQVKKPRHSTAMSSHPVRKRFIRFANSCLVYLQFFLAKMTDLLIGRYLAK